MDVIYNYQLFAPGYNDFRDVFSRREIPFPN